MKLIYNNYQTTKVIHLADERVKVHPNGVILEDGVDFISACGTDYHDFKDGNFRVGEGKANEVTCGQCKRTKLFKLLACREQSTEEKCMECQRRFLCWTDDLGDKKW